MTWPSGGDPNQPYGGPPQQPYQPQQPGPPAYQQPYPQPGPPPPPPMPYDPGPYGQAPPPPPYVAPKKSKKGLIIGLSILGVFIIAAIVGVGFLVAAMKDTTIATEMKLGDCITDVPTDSRVLTLPTIDCAQPHGGEVYAVITMPDGDYPGQAKIDQYQNQCPDKLAAFSPDAMTDDSVGIYVLYPTPETWERDDRTVTCIATLDPKRAGSLKG